LHKENNVAAEITQSRQLDESSPSVHTHLNILQGVVQRMASNSASCKTWCITIVSAVLVLIADKGKPELFWLALFPIPVFAALDIYYLGLERGFRASYNTFVNRLHNGSLSVEDLYSVTPAKEIGWLRAESLFSYSVLGFYTPLALLAFVLKWFVA
jgi:hypothetical protein